jgi:hypothetical protein
LAVVEDDVLPIFEEAARKLIEMEGDHAVRAVSRTLAFISGYHRKESSKQKSDY